MTKREWPGAPRPEGWFAAWMSLPAGQKAGLIGAAVLILALGVLVLIGTPVRPPARPAPAKESSTPPPKNQPERAFALSG